MYVNPICVSDMKNILSGMQPKNSCGLDEIPMSILKLSTDNILVILCHIFYFSLGQGKFINHFTKAKIMPVHKKDPKLMQTIIDQSVYYLLCPEFWKEFSTKGCIFEPSRFFLSKLIRL